MVLGRARGDAKAPHRRVSAGVPSELREQVALARRLTAAGLLWCHVPNGGYRSSREAAALAASGVKAGVPDVLVFTPPPAAPGAPGCALELKALGGSPSEEQRVWLAALAALGWATVVAYGCDDAVEQLRLLGYRL